MQWIPRSVAPALEAIDWGSVVMAAGAVVLVFVGAAAVVHRLRQPRAKKLQDAPKLDALPIRHGTTIAQLPMFIARLKHRLADPEPNAVAVFDDVIAMGFSLNASDLHFAPTATGTRVSMRVHGTLYDLAELAPDLYLKVLSRVKVLAELSFYKKAIPQDGQFDVAGKHKVRVSVVPTNHGEKIVLRLASAAYGAYSLEKLGMSTEMLSQLRAVLNSTQGMIIVTGPTGSGKTTTMYASMMHIHTERGDSVNFVTLEDPIEFDFPMFSQTQIEPESGMTFAVGLRAILRQDPDVILVGEIRDEETANIALRAALTGHLLFSTIHADSAAGVFNRIIQMGIERYLAASAVRLVISQRLCRRLCPHCREETTLGPDVRKQLEFLGFESNPAGPFFKAAGCPKCLGKGTDGRAAVYEALLVDDDIRDMINEGKPTHQIAHRARERGMISLLDDGLARARTGEIDMEELVRILTQ